MSEEIEGSTVDVEATWPFLYEHFYKPAGLVETLPKQRVVLCSQHRNNIVVGGVGASKSWTAAHFAWPRMLSGPLPGSPVPVEYWFVGETLEIPHTEMNYAADAIREFGVPIAKYNTPSEGRWEFLVEGVCNVQTRSWTNWDSLHGRPTQGMVICEAGLLPFKVWHERLRPRLARVPGSWVVMAGTLEDSGPFFKSLVNEVVIENRLRGWFGLSMATWDNTFTYPGGLENEEIKLLRETTPPDIFMERYGAIPKTVAALVYREFSYTFHVGNYPFDENQPVYLWIDPGGTYALNAVQRKGDDIFVIDEIHMEQATHERVIVEAVDRPWWTKVDHGAMDATQVEARLMWQEGRVWSSVGAAAIPIIHKKVPVEAGIELVRTQLHSGLYDPGETKAEDVWDFQGRRGVAKLHVDARCAHTIREFTQGYKRKRLASGQYSDSEVVKRDDHHMDCIRYGLADMLGFSESARPSVRAAREWYDNRPISVR